MGSIISPSLQLLWYRSFAASSLAYNIVWWLLAIRAKKYAEMLCNHRSKFASNSHASNEPDIYLLGTTHFCLFAVGDLVCTPDIFTVLHASIQLIYLLSIPVIAY